MKIITKAIFTEEEKEALIKIARIDCKDFACSCCPFNMVEADTCLKSCVRNMLVKERISWHE